MFLQWFPFPGPVAKPRLKNWVCPTIIPLTGGKIYASLSHRSQCYVKCKEICWGFKLGLLYLFPTMITIEQWVPPWLVGFYGISTFVVYLMPNPFLCKSTVHFHTIQFSMSTQFNCQKHFYFLERRAIAEHFCWGNILPLFIKLEKFI